MPSQNAWNVQAGLYTCLVATHNLTDLLADGTGGIRDHVPASSSFPYIVIGDMSARPMSTQTYGGQEILATVHSYSRAEGMKELKSVMHAVQEALHDADFSVTGATLVLCQETSSETYLESDGETRHGIQRFRIITES